MQQQGNLHLADKHWYYFHFTEDELRFKFRVIRNVPEATKIKRIQC